MIFKDKKTSLFQPVLTFSTTPVSCNVSTASVPFAMSVPLAPMLQRYASTRLNGNHSNRYVSVKFQTVEHVSIKFHQLQPNMLQINTSHTGVFHHENAKSNIDVGDIIRHWKVRKRKMLNDNKQAVNKSNKLKLRHRPDSPTSDPFVSMTTSAPFVPVTTTTPAPFVSSLSASSTPFVPRIPSL